MELVKLKISSRVGIYGEKKFTGEEEGRMHGADVRPRKERRWGGAEERNTHTPNTHPLFPFTEM